MNTKEETSDDIGVFLMSSEGDDTEPDEEYASEPDENEEGQPEESKSNPEPRPKAEEETKSETFAAPPPANIHDSSALLSNGSRKRLRVKTDVDTQPAEDFFVQKTETKTPSKTRAKKTRTGAIVVIAILALFITLVSWKIYEHDQALLHHRLKLLQQHKENNAALQEQYEKLSGIMKDLDGIERLNEEKRKLKPRTETEL